MTAVQMNTLNAQIWRDMGILADSETMLKRVAKYLSKLVAEKETDATLLSKEEFFRRVDEGREQIRRGECIQFSDHDEMTKWLNSL